MDHINSNRYANILTTVVPNIGLSDHFPVFVSRQTNFDDVNNSSKLLKMYIQQLLTIDHDCPVPVDKHGSVKNFTRPFDPIQGVKGQIFKLRNY